MSKKKSPEEIKLFCAVMLDKKKKETNQVYVSMERSRSKMVSIAKDHKEGTESCDGFVMTTVTFSADQGGDGTLKVLKSLLLLEEAMGDAMIEDIFGCLLKAGFNAGRKVKDL